MFGTSWKYSLGRKFNVKCSIIHTYHTYLPYGNSHITSGNLAGQSSGNPFVIHFNWCFMDFKRFSLILIDFSLILMLFHCFFIDFYWFGSPICHTYLLTYGNPSSHYAILTYHTYGNAARKSSGNQFLIHVYWFPLI